MFFLEEKDYVYCFQREQQREAHFKDFPLLFQRVRIQFLMFQTQSGSRLWANVTGQLFTKEHLQTFCIYIITVFTVHISILKALRNLVVEKLLYLLNTAFYNFFDFRTLLSSMPINIKYALEIVRIINFFCFCGFNFILMAV